MPKTNIIKYRVWDSIKMLYKVGDKDSIFNFKNKIAMESTNLFDCFGKEIYQYDFVSDDDTNKIYYVDYRYGTWCLIHPPTCGSEREGECKWDYLNNFPFALTVIGNEFETPKYLEQ